MRSFIGSGLRMPLALTGGGFARVDGAALLVQSIWTILNTLRGEREMRPEFGSSLYDLVLASDDPAALGRVARDVQEALRRWEPRIEVLHVDATPDPASPERILVRIEYAERATNSRQNLVYPFYLL